MGCPTSCKLCPNLVISQSVTFTAPNLVVNIPAGTYNNGCKYCLVIAQAIPEATTINAPVVITIGEGTEQYPLNRCNGAQATAANIRTRTRYSTCVATTATSGSFNLMGRTCCAPNNALQGIDGTAPTA